MPFPDIRLVTGPSTTATTVYDFNPNTNRAPGCWVLRESLDFGAPGLLGEPDAISPLYDNRKLRFTVRVGGTKAQALPLLSTMGRALINPGPGGRGWLCVQLNALTKPVWFRVFRPDLKPLKLENVTALAAQTGTELWDVDVEIEAEPFAYGARVVLGTWTITNDPGSGAQYPASVTLPPVAGDAPAPLIIESTTGAIRRFLMHLHSAQPSQGPVLHQIGTSDAFFTAGDSAPIVNSSAASGGSYRSIPFTSGAALAPRLTRTTLTGLSSGRWKAMLRIGRSDAESTFTARLSQITANGVVPGQIAATGPSTVSERYVWLDLGDFDFPVFGRVKGAGLPLSALFGYNIEVGRTSGTGQARLDALLFLPVDLDATTAATTLYTTIDDGNRAVWDGLIETVYGLDGVGAVRPIRPGMQGFFPAAVPGVTNILTMLQFVEPGMPTGSDVNTATSTVTVSTHPRLLNVWEL